MVTHCRGLQPGKSYPNTTELAGFVKDEPDLLRFVFAGSGYIIATAIAC